MFFFSWIYGFIINLHFIEVSGKKELNRSERMDTHYLLLALFFFCLQRCLSYKQGQNLMRLIWIRETENFQFLQLQFLYIYIYVCIWDICMRNDMYFLNSLPRSSSPSKSSVEEPNTNLLSDIFTGIKNIKKKLFQWKTESSNVNLTSST